MTISTVERKVPQGKFLRIKLQVEGSKLVKVLIEGDFFIHPEETLEQLEKSLEGLPANCDREQMKERLDDVVRSNEALLIGFSVEDIVALLEEGLCSGKDGG